MTRSVVQSLCALGSCDHEPYDTNCEYPDYCDQPCCGLRVHIDDLDSDDPSQHDENCKTRKAIR